MPRLSVWSIRAALSYLLLGFTFGALMLGHKGVPLHPLVWRLLPAHIEFLFFGWTVQLVLGVAYWILPRFQTERNKSALAWSAFALLNLGVWLVGIAPVVGAPPSIYFGGRLAEMGAAIAFALHAWPRIKPTGA
jgi:hypothetical protein